MSQKPAALQAFCAPHVVTAVTLALTLTSAAKAQPYSSGVVIATGQEGFVSLEAITSINTAGAMAFSGVRPISGPNLSAVYYMTSPGAALVPVSFSSAGRTFTGVALSDGISIGNQLRAEIATRELVTGPSFLVRRWTEVDQPATSWTPTIIGTTTQSDFNSAQSFVAISDLGNVAFPALVSSSTSARLFSGFERPPTSLGTFALGTLLRPMISDAGRVIVRTQASTLALYDSVSGANPAPEIIASSAIGGFTSIGPEPGISDDGRYVAAIGDRGNGIGVFVWYRADPASPHWRGPFRVAGENAVPGQGSTAELGCDIAGTPIAFSTFDSNQRVAVVSSAEGQSTLLGIRDDQIIVTFAATPSAASPSGAFSSQPGYWSVRARPCLARTASGLQESAGLIADPPSKIVQVGDTVGGRVVTALRAYDPLATRAVSSGTPDVRAANHWVGVWLADAGGSQVMRFQPGPAAPTTSFRKFKQFISASGFSPAWAASVINPFAASPTTMTSAGCVITSLAAAANVFSGTNHTSPGAMRQEIEDARNFVVIRDQIRQRRRVTSAVNLASWSHRLPDGRVLRAQSLPNAGWPQIVQALSACNPTPLMLGVPSRSKGLPGVVDGVEKHYLLAYALNPNRPAGGPVRPCDVLIMDPGYGGSFYDDPNLPGFIPYRDAEDLTVRLTLADYFAAVSRLAPGGLGYNPDTVPATDVLDRIEAWFSQRVVYNAAGTAVAMNAANQGHIVRTFVASATFARGPGGAISSVSGVGPVELLITSSAGGTRYLTDPADVAGPGDVLLQKEPADLVAPREPDDDPEDLPSNDQPFIVVLPPELSGQSLLVAARGVADGPFEIVHHTGSLDLTTSAPLEGQATPGSIASVTFTVSSPACIGDADGSGSVNFGDITSVLANFGAVYGGPFLAGDANGDAVVSFADITTVLANFGGACP